MTTKPGILVSAFFGILLIAFAISIDFPKANGGGFKGDESTYYVLAHSLAEDLDFQFEKRDLVRVWQEFPGPQGIFLKRGKDIDVRTTRSFPFLRWVKQEDPLRETRLYFSKSYIYPLVAAPFVYVFGTNGFLVLHAILLTLDLFVIYLFLCAVSKSNWIAVPLSIAFLGVSVIPVYLVWLTPELFNFSLALYAVFLWAYKEVAPEVWNIGGARFLFSRRSDHAAAILIALATFSKPPHLLFLVPMLVLAVLRKQWRQAMTVSVVCVSITGALFAANAMITGEFNYQGGDRKTFYNYTGFPFANSWETFDTMSPVRGREDLMVGDVLVNTHSGTVFRHNLAYFIFGRNAGLLPYFFPGILALILFLFSRDKRIWQWLVLATIVIVIVMHVFVWPFTWNGGGGPVGSRYVMSFYPLFLLLFPATAGIATVFAAFVGGALFTAQLVLNPFFASLHPGDHTKRGPLRMLPIELTLIRDLPVAQNRDRSMVPLGPPPPHQGRGYLWGYFPDDNAFNAEETPAKSRDWWFWVKGKSKAEVVLRGPVDPIGEDKYVTRAIARLTVEVRNGGSPNRVTIATGSQSQTLDLAPGELQAVSLTVPSGVPFRREVQPTSYLYMMSIETTAGFVPFLDIPCDKPGTCASDSRFLGAMIHLIPEYTDADITIWRVHTGGGIGAGKDETGGIHDAR
jgi:hypothetical protein